jgi:hypothetical protein
MHSTAIPTALKSQAFDGSVSLYPLEGLIGQEVQVLD